MALSYFRYGLITEVWWAGQGMFQFPPMLNGGSRPPSALAAFPPTQGLLIERYNVPICRKAS
jgi:hypothetical protein